MNFSLQILQSIISLKRVKRIQGERHFLRNSLSKLSKSSLTFKKMQRVKKKSKVKSDGKFMFKIDTCWYSITSGGLDLNIEKLRQLGKQRL